MVERVNPVLPVFQQCRLLAVSRLAVYRKPVEVSAEDLAIMALIDRQYLVRPYYGSRRMAAWLATQGHVVNRKRVQRLMRLLGLVAIDQRPNASRPAAAHKVYPYLLGGIAIEWVNQVWCADVTYIPMAKRFLYLVVIMDEPRGAGVATFEHARCRLRCIRPISDGFIMLIRSVVPLIIFATVAVGIAKMGDMRRVGVVRLRAIIYFEVVSSLALLVGLTVGNRL
jgi:putative transposase